MSASRLALVIAAISCAHPAAAATFSIDARVDARFGRAAKSDQGAPITNLDSVIQRQEQGSTAGRAAGLHLGFASDILGDAASDFTLGLDEGVFRGTACASATRACDGSRSPNPTAISPNIAFSLTSSGSVSLTETFRVTGDGFADVALHLDGFWDVEGFGSEASFTSTLHAFNLTSLDASGAPTLAFKDVREGGSTSSGAIDELIAGTFAVRSGDEISVTYALRLSALSGRAADGRAGHALIDFGDTAELDVEGDEGATVTPRDALLLTSSPISANDIVRSLPHVLATRGSAPPAPAPPAPVPLPPAAGLLALGLAALALARSGRKPRHFA